MHYFAVTNKDKIMRLIRAVCPFPNWTKYKVVYVVLDTVTKEVLGVCDTVEAVERLTTSVNRPTTVHECVLNPVP